jgi:hypothetical protein
MPNPSSRVFSRNTAPEGARVPEGGQTPRSSDTLVGDTDSPDPDYHPEAQANAVADTEAGAMPDEEMGRIEPLKRRD